MEAETPLLSWVCMTAAEAWLWLEPTEGFRQPHNVHYGLLVSCPMLTE